jgi:hypothetical protein
MSEDLDKKAGIPKGVKRGSRECSGGYAVISTAKGDIVTYGGTMIRYTPRVRTHVDNKDRKYAYPPKGYVPNINAV